MINDAQRRRALEAIQALIVRARFVAYECGESELADLLDDMEILPVYLANPDGISEFREMLAGIVEKRPELQYVLTQFDKGPAPENGETLLSTESARSAN